ncbi:MAG TPA: ATP-binding protein [Polyangiaceae bacterium]|nr:ATP-binding protein [Polyangiaceae bacterium]
MAARVLVIDDNLDLAANLADILEGARELEVEVTCCPEGQSGVRAAAREGFDVAIVDVKLPDASGVDLIRPLRASSAEGEIILITGFATVDTAIAALRAGAFAFLLKSFRPEELISTVEQALAKVALKREREELERRYRALVEAADVLIVALERDGKVALMNPRVAALADVSASAATGEPFVQRYIAADDREKFTQAVTDIGQPKKGSSPVRLTAEVEAGIVGPKGAVRRIRWHLSGVVGARGEPDLVYGIGIDVTERRALERRAADAEALSAMGSLALGLAHEVRNPLNAAVLQLHLLARGVDRLGDEKARATMRSRVTIIEGEIARLERLLTEFLELARPRGIRHEPVDVSRLVEEVLEFQAEALNDHHVELEAAIASGCVAKGDPEKLRQVVINLLVNALDAMPESGTLSVKVSSLRPIVAVEIGDSGPGIDPRILPEIFDPFFTTKEAGTGLGLSIVRKIVDQHGGRIEFDSIPGRGTRVRVELPLAAATAAGKTVQII